MTSSSARQRKAVLATVLGAFLLVTACGNQGGQNDDDPGSTGQALLPEAEGTTAYPLTLDTWLGETVLEERPERIAVVGGSTNADALELLDVTPVYVQKRPGSDYTWNEAAWFEDEEIIDERDEPGANLERIAAAEPDLIIGVDSGAGFEDDFAELAEIAPVLESEEQVHYDQVDWAATHRLIGQTLDLGAAADQAVDDAEQAIEEVAQAHPEFEGITSTLAYDYGAEFGVDYYTVAGGTAEEVMGRLGFEPNPLAADFVADNSVSEENMRMLDGDVLIMFYTDDADQQTREESELFQQVPAVADGRYVPVSAEVDDRAQTGAIWALRSGTSPLSLPWTVEAIADWASTPEFSD